MKYFLKLITTCIIALGFLPGVMAQNVEPDPDCPLDYFYRGYDLIKGNPASAKDDTGWRLAIMEEGRLGEKCVTCSARTVCTSEYEKYDMDTELDYYYSLYEKVDVSASSEDFLVSTAFTGSAEYQYQQQNVFGLGLTNVQAEASCQLFQGGRDLNCTEVSFTSGFANVIDAFPTSTTEPDWFNRVAKFFNDYGTHIIGDTVSLGARWSYESTFTQANYEAMRAGKVNIDAAAEASAEFFRTKGASGAYESEEITEMRVMFDGSSKTKRALYIGALPPTELSIGEWANTIDNPIPQMFNLFPLSELLTPYFFPNDPNIAAKREVMEAGYLLYCASVPGCHEPEPPAILHVKAAEYGHYERKNELSATCPAGYQLIGGGCQTEFAAEPDRWIIPSMKPMENSYYCMVSMDDHDTISTFYKGLSVTATCLRNDYVEDIQIIPCVGTSGEYGSECIAQCPSGFYITGGGCESNAIDIQLPWKVTSSRPIYSGDGVWNAWSCHMAEDASTRTFYKQALGYAVCTRYADNKFIHQKTIGDFSGTQEKYTNGSVVQCDAGYEVLTGGCTAGHQSKPTDEWKVIESQPSGSMAWSCLAQEDRTTQTYNEDVQTEALCVRLNSADK